MADAKRELSGFFLSAGKFASHVEALASPCCTTSYLRLFHNEPHHTAAVLDALARNASITALDIFELDAGSATALAGLLSASPRLASLAVHHPHGLDAVQNLCRGLAANRSLTRLHLARLDPRGVAELSGALLSWTRPPPPPPSSPPADAGEVSNAAAVGAPAPSAQLHRLRLERCSLTPEAAAALSAALGGQASALAELEIVESELGDAAAEALLAAPAWARLVAAGALVGLDLSTCHVGPRGAAALGRLLAASPSLHSLNLANNKALGCEGAKALAAGLVSNRALRRLDMSRCGVGADGVQALAAALALQPAAGGDGDMPDEAAAAASPPLEQLVLTDNAAAAVGLEALLRSMSGPRPCALRTLQLERNHIRCVELLKALGLPTAAVAAAPQPVPTAAALDQAPDLPRVAAPLEQLSLAGNALYDAGVAVLAACLAAAPCLEQLDIRENGISDGGVAALLPLIAPRGAGGGGGRGSGGGAPAVSMMDVVTAAPSAGLQGLMLDGNRLHNAGGQALLAAVTAAPGLWRFSAEANKLTDPALRLSLTQLSQMRAARHSQLVVQGRYYSSSSSSSSEDGGHRGGGAGGGGGGGGSGNGNEATSPMDLDCGGAAPPPTARPQGRGGGNRGGPAHQQHHHHHHHHKHRLDETDAADGEVSSGDVQRQSGMRNVAARGADEGDAGGGACGADAGAAFVISGGARPLGCPAGRLTTSDVWPCMPPADAGRGGGGGGGWYGARAVIGCNGSATADPSCRDRSSGGASSTDCGSCDEAPMRRASSGGASAASSGAANVLMLCGSPPPAMCFVKAVVAAAGVGGAASVGVSKRLSGVGESDHPSPVPTRAESGALPQQLLPACRRPRYKPLTPEQQRLFEDF